MSKTNEQKMSEQKFVEARNNFKDAAHALSVAFDGVEDGYGAKNYPFKEDFFEVKGKINDWAFTKGDD